MTDKPASFDYIVIGAGSAGCVVANRLSGRHDLKVLLLEAGGGDDLPEIHEPQGLARLFASKVNIDYLTEPVPSLAGRIIPISRGKVLGGCSSTYAMIHVRGNRRDFDFWNYLGNEGWSYSHVLPYFIKLEDFEGGASEYHGVGGPVSIRYNPEPTPLAYAFIHAARELGFSGQDWDYNGLQQENGASHLQFTLTREGKRASTSTAYLKPVMGRSNLSIQTCAQATRIIVEGGRPRAVEYNHHGGLTQAKVDREVIVCAGAFESPKLLMLSGIGPASQLKAHGIEVLVDLEGVGQNLQDHVRLPLTYRLKVDLPIPSFVAEVALFTYTRPGLAASAPDLQILAGGGVPGFQTQDFGPWFSFVPTLIKPQSRGTLALRSSNPFDLPVIQPNYLECETDLQVLGKGLELTGQFMETRALTEFKAEFKAIESGPPLGGNEREIRNFIMSNCSTIWHPVGTCKMGRDRMAVVDPQLRVYGLHGLRIADASIMPMITSGNTNAPCMMIGEKCADMILNEGT